MVDFTRIQNRIYYGYTKAAQRLGTPHAIYRSADGLNPIQSGNLITTTRISVDKDLTYKKANKYGDATWQFLPENGLSLQNYDYMVGASATYFIVDIAPDDRLSPPLCVECNATISLYSLKNTLTPGKNNYQASPGEKPAILTNCPVAILQYTRTDNDNMRLPTSVKNPMYQIIAPDFDDIIIRSGQLTEDDKGRRMVVVNAEQTKKTLGLRILAQEKEV